MHVWLELILRELLFTGLVMALGIGPASFLSDRFDRAARLTMAPALGMCVGVCVTVTLAYEYPARETKWLLIGLAALSLALAAWHRPPRWRGPGLRSSTQVAVVVVAVLASFDYPLAMRGTVGPVGGYQIGDTSGYVSEINGIAHESIRQAKRVLPPFSDLAIGAWSNYARGTQQLDVSALEANFNELLGLGATDTQSPFLIAILLVGGLGAFSVIRCAWGSPTWMAVLAGCLFAGPLFVELFMDGSEAAIAGGALIAPIVAIGLEAIIRRSAANLVLLALAAAGLQTVYPLFIPCVVIGAALGLAPKAWGALRSGQLSGHTVAAATATLASVIALSVVFTPVAFARNAHYSVELLSGTQSLAGLPSYDLPATVLPGWLLQTREFYQLVDPLSGVTSGRLLLAVAVPLVLLAVIALAVRRNRFALALLSVATGASLMAFYTWSDRACSYCVQRNLLPVGFLVPAALGIGLAALAALRWRAAPWLAGLVALITVLNVGYEGLVERQRLTQAAYLLDAYDRQALHWLPQHSGPVEVEGFSEGAHPPMELPLVYNLTNEQTGGDLSLPTITNDGNGLAYLISGSAPLGPAFKANYGYVLTRLAGIVTQRRTVAQYGPIALQRRTNPLDVTIISGVSVAPARLDPTGTAWVSSTLPLQFLVVGGNSARRPAWISLGLRATVPVKVLRNVAFSSDEPRAGDLQICLRVTGNPPVRDAMLQTVFVPQPPPLSPDRYDLSLPPRGLSLQSMRVSARSCARAARMPHVRP